MVLRSLTLYGSIIAAGFFLPNGSSVVSLTSFVLTAIYKSIILMSILGLFYLLIGIIYKYANHKGYKSFVAEKGYTFYTYFWGNGVYVRDVGLWVYLLAVVLWSARYPTICLMLLLIYTPLYVLKTLDAYFVGKLLGKRRKWLIRNKKVAAKSSEGGTDGDK